MWASAWVPAYVDFVAHFPSNSRFFRRAQNRRILSICVVTLPASSAQPMTIFAFDFVGNTYTEALMSLLSKSLTHRLLRTLLPSIFMTGVHPPSPHPKSPMWQRTDVGFESKIIVTIWVLFVLDKEDTFWLINNCSETCIRRTLEHSLRVSKHAGFSLFT